MGKQTKKTNTNRQAIERELEALKQAVDVTQNFLVMTEESFVVLGHGDTNLMRARHYTRQAYVAVAMFREQCVAKEKRLRQRAQASEPGMRHTHQEEP